MGTKSCFPPTGRKNTEVWAADIQDGHTVSLRELLVPVLSRSRLFILFQLKCIVRSEVGEFLQKERVFLNAAATSAGQTRLITEASTF